MKEKLTELLKELKIAYSKSEVRKYCKEKNKKWGYELIQTALEENQPLVIGYNWGVDNDWEEYIDGSQYESQKTIKKVKFVDIYKGSLERAMNMCNQYFKNIDFDKGSHSNFCFFRSDEREYKITWHDINLCIPIFRKMIDIVNPSVVFCFSSKARDYMMRNDNLIKGAKKETVSKNDSSYHAGKGIIKNGAKIYFLPHPNSQLKKEVRDMAWEFCSE